MFSFQTNYAFYCGIDVKLCKQLFHQKKKEKGGKEPE